MFRLARPQDSLQLAELAQEAYGKYDGLVAEPPAPILLDYAKVASLNRTYVLEEEGLIQGMVTVETSGDHLILRNLAVRPRLQGRGIGRDLARRVEGMARDRNKRGIKLWTRAEMVDNIAFYESLGYCLTHAESSGGAHRVHFVKNIDVHLGQLR